MAELKNGTTAAPTTKMEAVELTLAELGSDTMPVAIKDHLKRKYGMEISAAVASDYKKKLKQRAKAAGKPETAMPNPVPPVAKMNSTPKKAKKPAPSAKKADSPKQQVLQTPKNANGASDSVLLADVLITKDLLDRVGVEKLRTLIDGLAK